MGFTKVIQSGSMLEIFQYENDIISPHHRRKPKWKRQFRPKLDRIRPDNIYRKKRSFARLVRANLTGAERPSMFSFTVVKCDDLTVGYSFLTRFFKVLREFNGQTFRYIAVPEFQKRGAVHFHALVWGLPQETILNERNIRFYQHIWQRGYLDCVPTDGNIKLAGYLAKYMAKAMFDKRLLGRKAYTSSRNIQRPAILPFATAVGFAKDIWGIDLSTDEALQERNYQSKYLGKGRYRVYNINFN